ncbi:formyltetrahydrofolate-dependent phosphoribosylglycinamide formyltransferase [Enteractinococcus coprophilus]|uniref:Phosphoribosylglycinamide formyltransferase n=1 Tax=Enteractinococcus coprophilus TaxID=1027633 RepID=A0A543AFK7_9MICC|nr:formyltetrahydrofolate-dependent phosphoribosylglycinamide formyltransferase [Enteractinococcus coprophilus]
MVVLLSGSGSNFQTLIDAVEAGELGVEIVAAGSDVTDAFGLTRAKTAGIETFVVDYATHDSRAAWTTALAEKVATYRPDIVLSSGLMRIVGEEFITRFANRFINTHPALLPAFPGAHAVADALAAGVVVTGTTLHIVDAGVDTGPILDQRAVTIAVEDDEASLHEKIKVAERQMLLDNLARMATGTTPEQLIRPYAEPR